MRKKKGDDLMDTLRDFWKPWADDFLSYDDDKPDMQAESLEDRVDDYLESGHRKSADERKRRDYRVHAAPASEREREIIGFPTEIVGSEGQEERNLTALAAAPIPL